MPHDNEPVVFSYFFRLTGISLWMSSYKRGYRVMILIYALYALNRGIAQLGSAPASGAGGREFKSRYPESI